MPVEVATLAAHPVEQASEYIATLKARRSTIIQPQVEGFITNIAVRSGDRVQAGALLFEIDSNRPRAAVSQLESVRAARQADVEYAQQQAKRSTALFDAGAISQRELEQADTAVRTTSAQLKAIDDQIRETQVQLGYYKVTSPNAGIVGDVPVRVGDSVIKATVLTTVDTNEGLEIYVNVPVQQAPLLKIGLPVKLLDESGQVVATNTVNFIAPSVDERTQSVLAKAALVDGRGNYRADQFVRVRLVWSMQDGITVPVTAVTRVNGQFFVFLAEAGERGTVARQTPVQLGELVGNDYVVRGGVKAGDKLIVSGIQKIGEGAPVMVGGMPPAQKKAS
jgi:RND family efflux transporter MFP subunit